MIHLSIIIPYFNTALLLQKLLDSIPMQEDIEVIVIDDNSTQNQDIYHTITQNKKYQNVLFLKNTTPYKGPGASRNIGIEKAQGKWILFADADDFFLKDFYNNISPYFTSQYDVVFFTPTSVDLETGKKGDRHLYIERHLRNYLSNPSLKNELDFKYEIFSPCSKLIQKKLLMKHDIFFDTAKAYEDVIFSVQLGFFMQEFFISQKVIYCITHHKDSITTNTSQEYLDLHIASHIQRAIFLKKRLPKKHFKILANRGHFFMVNKFNFGLKNALQTFFLLKKNKIPPIKPKFYNPFYLVYRILKNKVLNKTS